MAVVKNTAARLIDISHDGKTYRAKPASAAIEVPDAALKSKFVEALVSTGQLEVVSKGKAKPEQLREDLI